jgi:hypothetical protein
MKNQSGILTAAECLAVVTRCPCGGSIHSVEHVTGDGPMRDGAPTQHIRVFYRALYYDAAHDRDFCSPACAARWFALFRRPFERHTTYP